MEIEGLGPLKLARLNLDASKEMLEKHKERSGIPLDMAVDWIFEMLEGIIEHLEKENG